MLDFDYLADIRILRRDNVELAAQLDSVRKQAEKDRQELEAEKERLKKEIRQLEMLAFRQAVDGFPIQIAKPYNVTKSSPFVGKDAPVINTYDNCYCIDVLPRAAVTISASTLHRDPDAIKNKVLNQVFEFYARAITDSVNEQLTKLGWR